MSKQLQELGIQRRVLEQALREVEAKEESVRRVVDEWVSPEQVEEMLEAEGSPNFRVMDLLPRVVPVLKTLRYLRPPPHQVTDMFSSWHNNEEDFGWAVDVDRRDGTIQLVFKTEDVAFDFLSPEDAEMVGRWLLGAAHAARVIQLEKGVTVDVTADTMLSVLTSAIEKVELVPGQIARPKGP